MTAPRFFHEGDFTSDETVELSPTEAAHALRVMRLEPGDSLLLLNGAGLIGEATLLEDGTGSRKTRHAYCRVTTVQYHDRPAPRLLLYVAPPRNKNMDLVLKAATELGAGAIIPIICRYSVSKPETDSGNAWRQTLVAAAKQSINPWLPELRPVASFAQALENADCHGFFGAVPRPEDDHGPRPFQKTDTISLWIGPEGGFAPEEEQALREKGLVPLTVGPWVLRVETAVTALLGVLQAAFGPCPSVLNTVN